MSTENSELRSLQEKLERYELAISAANIGVWDWEVSSDTVYISKIAKAQMGYEDHELENKFSTWVNHMHPDEAEDVQRVLEEYLANPVGRYVNEFRFRHKNGSYIWILSKAEALKNDKGEVIRMFGSHTDITKRKETELQLQAIYNQSSEGITIADMDGKYVFVNPAFCKMSGYSEEELLQMTVFDMKAKGQNHNSFEETKKSSKLVRVTLQKKDGSEYFSEIMGDVITVQNKKLVLGIIRDITDTVEKEKELIIAKEKAEESNRLKTEFLNNMSHEIRTPMNGIMGFTELLSDNKLSEEKRKLFISIIKNSGNQLLRVIDDILEISKLETKQVKVFNEKVCLNEMLLELFSIFDLKAKENKTSLYFSKGLSDKESTLYTDESKLNKILSNLIENALKFTQGGVVDFGYVLKDSKIEIYVKDTGLGISKDKQETIFERFSQEEKEISLKDGGLGLGLSIAKENAELLGGEITLSSTKNIGSTFFVTIPYDPVGADLSATEEKKTGNTILIAEDEEVNYLFIETLIEGFDFDVNILHAKNGKEAVDMCKNNDVELILMDLKMPIMDGFKAAKLIKDFREDIPIVAQTAYSSGEDRAKALFSGCDDFISKPIDKNRLKTILENYLAI